MAAGEPGEAGGRFGQFARFGGGDAAAEAEGGATATCDRWGAPATSGTCAFCRPLEKASGAEPVRLTRKGRPIDA